MNYIKPTIVFRNIKLFFKLIRFNVHINSLMVIVGFVIAKSYKITFWDISYILWCYLLISLMYGAIYITNDIIDINRDRNHPEKKIGRAIASGEVSIKTGIAMAIILLTVSLILAIKTNVNLFIMELIFVLITTIYTFFAKKYAYFDILFNAFTHPLRTLTGTMLAGASLFSYKELIITHFISALSMAGGRRYREYLNGTLNARPALAKYSLQSLNFLQYLFAGLNLIHLYLTPNTPALFVRIIMVSIPLILHFVYYKGSPLKRSVDVWYFGKA